MLDAKFGIVAKLQRKNSHGRVYPFILLNAVETKKLAEKIAPYVFGSMKYKLPKEFRGVSCVL